MMNAHEITLMQTWVCENAYTAALADAYRGGHERGQAIGRTEVNAAAVQAKHEAMLADMDALFRTWKKEPGTGKGYSYEYVRKGMEAKYVARTKSPRLWGDRPNVAKFLKEVGTRAFDATMQEARQKAAKAEHEKTVEEMDALLRKLKEQNPHCLPFSIDYLRSRMEAEYVARTHPKPDTVTVRMPRKTYENLQWSNVALARAMELLDPPGESVAEKAAE